MREPEIPIIFQPHGKRTYVLAGTRIVEAAGTAGLALGTPCGGVGTCGKCRVIVRQGAAPPNDRERRLFTSEQLVEGYRLACQTAIHEPTVVEVPAASLPASSFQILTATGATTDVAVRPAVAKRYVELPTTTRLGEGSDWSRLESQLGRLDVDLDLLSELPARLRHENGRGTAVTADGRLLDFEPGDTRGRSFAAAVDVGTTTLALSLVDLNTGEETTVVSRVNPQTAFGDDVLSRIANAREGRQKLHAMQTLVIEAVEAMIAEATETTGVARREIYEITFAGNTTMQHLLCGLDPGGLGEAPFAPAYSRGISTAASTLGLQLHPRARAYVFPVIGGFIGGDTTAGILAAGLRRAESPALLVDIGTNGEIVLCVDGRLSAASTAAGPAFEGARITHGMRAGDGAIEKAVVDERLRLNVIGNISPIGLCGSALIDLAAELLRHGVVGEEGRLRSPDQLPSDAPHDLRRRLTVHNQQPAFLLVTADESGTGEPILLTQRDLRELQLASGAIRAGIGVLLRRAGLAPRDLKTVLLAGGFGNYLRRRNAQRIGLLPGEIDRHRIRYQGNTSLAGARLAAVSVDAKRLAEELAATTEHVDLSSDPLFREAFTESMLFPDETGEP